MCVCVEEIEEEEEEKKKGPGRWRAVKSCIYGSRSL